MLAPPRLLALRDQAAEVAVRPAIPSGPGRGQKTLRRDPPLSPLHPLGDQGGHAVIVMAPRHPRRLPAAGLVPFDDPPDGLVRGPRDRRGPTVSACLTVGSNDVHAFPRRLQ